MGGGVPDGTLHCPGLWSAKLGPTGPRGCHSWTVRSCRRGGGCARPANLRKGARPALQQTPAHGGHSSTETWLNPHGCVGGPSLRQTGPCQVRRDPESSRGSEGSSRGLLRAQGDSLVQSPPRRQTPPRLPPGSALHQVHGGAVGGQLEPSPNGPTSTASPCLSFPICAVVPARRVFTEHPAGDVCHSSSGPSLQGSLSAPQGCRNKHHKLRLSLSLLWRRESKSRWGRLGPSGGSSGGSFLPLPASGGSRVPWLMSPSPQLLQRSFYSISREGHVLRFWGSVNLGGCYSACSGLWSRRGRRKGSCLEAPPTEGQARFGGAE